MQDVSNFNVFDKYFVEYNKKKSELIDAMSVIFDSNKIDLLWLYLEKMSNSNLNDYHNGIPSISSVKKYLTNDNILKTLDKEYWTIVIHESKILNYVSSSVKEEFSKSLKNFNMPEFNQNNVETTIRGLIKDLPSLFKQRLEDAFNVLSKEHKTNSSNMFNKRMVFKIANYNNNYIFSSDFLSRRCDAIDDICSTINQLLGYEQVEYNFTKGKAYQIANSNKFGQWIKLNENVAIKLFKVGTAHLEIRPEIADLLNSIIANGTIPNMSDDWYQKNKNEKQKEFHDMTEVLLSKKVIDEISKTLASLQNNSKVLLSKDTIEVLSYIDSNFEYVDGIPKFSYDVTSVLKHLFEFKTIPEYKSYQYYPTPNEIVDEIQKYVPITGNILEPSAGTGNLIFGLNKEKITCIELSKFHNIILKAKGFNSVEMDFLTYNTDEKYDCIVMNPPYSKNRALLHVNHAVKLLSENGYILAVLPTGKVNDIQYSYEVIEKFNSVFDKTNIHTSLVKIFK